MTANIYSNVRAAKSKFYKDAYNLVCEALDSQMYLMSSPWVDQQYKYEIPGCWVLLKPGYPITFVREDVSDEDFENYVDDFKEDLGHIINQYNYSEKLGRPRTWEHLFIEISASEISFEDYLESHKLEDPQDCRKVEIFISLLIGSVNQADEVSLDAPQNLLDRVKNKIMLFDTDQTRFLYQDLDEAERIIRIQGLAGTGKTELLLHKLKDIFLSEEESTICFTCHNRVLAGVLWERLIQFFNTKGVKRQIDYEKLFCFHAWGSYSNHKSGALSFICTYYDLPFYSLSEVGNFDNACKRTITNLKNSPIYAEGGKAFTYMFIDESQDFPDSFFKLCDMVTEKRVYAAGDIFQNIFTIVHTEDLKGAHVMLNRCYRTDPRTFMFAHGMGMGLFEKKKISWLKDEEWNLCGYDVEKLNDGNQLRLSRSPIKRFEDIPEGYDSIHLFITPNYMIPIIKLIEEWKKEYPTLQPDDIGIIMIDADQYIYDEAPKIAQNLERKYGWECNLAYKTKKRIKNTLFISNRNNVKGLEFPFVICLTHEIKNSMIYRHTLYTMLSRSHLQSILIVVNMNDEQKDNILRAGKEILSKSYVTIDIPTEDELTKIGKVPLVTSELHYSLEERAEAICKNLGVEKSEHILNFLKNSDKKHYTDSELEKAINQLWEMQKGI